MMNRFLLSLVLLVSVSINALSQSADAPDSFRLSLREGKGDAVELAFVSRPVVTYNDNGDLVITVEGRTFVYPQSDILKMTFFRSGTVTSILNAFDDGNADTNAKSGIYTMEGKQVESISTQGLYIINGKKVLVK